MNEYRVSGFEPRILINVLANLILLYIEMCYSLSKCPNMQFLSRTVSTPVLYHIKKIHSVQYIR